MHGPAWQRLCYHTEPVQTSRARVSKSGQEPHAMGRVLIPDYSKSHLHVTVRQDFAISWNVPRVALFLAPGAVQVLPYVKDQTKPLGVRPHHTSLPSRLPIRRGLGPGDGGAHL